jgi:outer membrane protein assembly factor BamA
MRARPAGRIALAMTLLATPAAAEPWTETDLVPIAGGNSDIGFGGGAVGAVTRFAGPDGGPQHPKEQWEWRLEGSALATFRISPFAAPYQDYYLVLTLPRLLEGHLRVTVRGAFTEETNVRYFGLGNATPTPPDDGSRRYQYTRTHPVLEALARAEIAPHAYFTVGGSYTHDFIDVPAETKLAADMRSGDPEIHSLLGDARSHGVALAEQSLEWDGRDDEVVPRSGTWDQIQLRLSPALGDAVPYSYGEVIAIGRVYVPVGERLVLGGRLLGDGLFGTPPFYALALYDDTYAVGGTLGVRGVPAGRYYGKIKVLGSVEPRLDVAKFNFLSKAWGLAVAAFFDAGRVWADWTRQPQLDGTGVGLKWGTGVGVRLQQGLAFVVRADLAWSPDARPIAGYFAAGETF